MSRRTVRYLPLHRVRYSPMASPLSGTAAPTQSGQRPLLITSGEEADHAGLESIDLFSVRRPKHAIAGLSSGLKNIGKVLIVFASFPLRSELC
jgi:hypothetical protein